ncbi:MAG: hypothetical protein BroJett040_06840 [Oligoflexia bacterium]|nr:MAG: hypothetical protein BroJett040_06840 [Oligoflexia bacterium]
MAIAEQKVQGESAAVMFEGFGIWTSGMHSYNSYTMERFRRGIVAVLINEIGQVLLCERSDSFNSWQFPQGGIEPGESDTEAFFRETTEELGNGNCEILRVGEHTTIYRWPESGVEYVGQEQTWFLARFRKGALPCLEKSDGCFRSWRWEDPSKVLA